MKTKWIGGLLCTLILEMAQSKRDTCNGESRSECESKQEGDNENNSENSHMYREENQRQIVLYDESKLFPHHRKKKVYELAGHELTILQDWTTVGVAGVVWDAAVILGEYIQERPEIVRDKRVIELGAGTGLVGMVAGLLGAEHVDITDRELAIEQLKENVFRNINGKCDSRVTVKELDWGQNLEKYFKYPVILGADIVYIEETFQELIETLKHLSDCETVVLLSCRIRYDRDKKFIFRLKKFFKVEVIHSDESKMNVIYKCVKLC